MQNKMRQFLFFGRNIETFTIKKIVSVILSQQNGARFFKND